MGDSTDSVDEFSEILISLARHDVAQAHALLTELIAEGADTVRLDEAFRSQLRRIEDYRQLLGSGVLPTELRPKSA